MKSTLLVCLVCAMSFHTSEARADKSLADAIGDRGVNEQTNTFGHALERTAAGIDKRLLYFFEQERRDALWKALRKATYVETRRLKPQPPFIFVVLNTGKSSRDRPVAEFWVDTHGVAYSPVDDDPLHRDTLAVFQAQELHDLLSSYVEKFGQPLPQ